MNIIFILNQTHLKINIIIGVQNYYFSLNIIYLIMTKVKMVNFIFENILINYYIIKMEKNCLHINI